jgi:hypothetical protein
MTATHCAKAVLVTLLLCTAAHAQTGPLEPRIVVAGQGYPEFDSDLAIDLLGATAELSVDVDGKVTAVKIIETSGNERFDRIVQNYYSKFRLIPGLTDAGQPVAAKSEVHFRVAIDENPQAERLQGPDDFLAAEIKRIRRMTCNDFNWEYEKMQEIAHGNELDREYLFQASFALAQAAQKLTGSEIEKLRRKSNAVVKDTAKQCRANPQAAFFHDAYVPAVLARAGR